MIKKIVFVCGVAYALSANAQSSNFEGASIAINYNNATLTDFFNEAGTIAESSNNASIQGAYSFALSEKALLSVGATYALGDLKAGSNTILTYEVKAKNLYTVYVEPAYVIGTTAIYGKLAYIATKGVVTYDVDYSGNLAGTGYGFGVRTMLDKNIFMQVEFMQTKFNSRTLYLSTELGGAIGTVGIGYKF